MNTHPRSGATAHSGFEFDTEVVLSSDIPDPLATNSGSTLHQALLDINTYLGHFLFGTADPTTSGGVNHSQPALYLRDNSGVTEMWTATNSGSTDWQQVTIP